MFTPEQTGALDRDDMWAHLRYIHLSVGSGRGAPGMGITEYDILPWKRQTKLGPERPSFVPLLEVMENVKKVLEHCAQIHFLKISIRGVGKSPGSMEMVIAPLRELRGVKRSDVVVLGMQDDFWVDWCLKGSYCRYLTTIMAMPTGTEAPPYDASLYSRRQTESDPSQEKTEEQKFEEEDSIFGYINKRWTGARSFGFPINEDGIPLEDLSDEYDDDEEDWEDDEEDEDEMLEFDEFMEYMGLGDGHPMMFGPGGPPGMFGEDDEDEDEWDEDEDDDEDDDDDDSEEEDSDEDSTDDEMPGLIGADGVTVVDLVGTDEEAEDEQDTDDEMPGLVDVAGGHEIPLPVTPRGGLGDINLDHSTDDSDESDDEMPELVPVAPGLPKEEPEGYEGLIDDDVD